jgi:hypothetical protein
MQAVQRTLDQKMFVILFQCGHPMKAYHLSGGDILCRESDDLYRLDFMVITGPIVEKGDGKTVS